jgi:16S rRNA (guanine527-N7)-methyltransferase
MAHKNESNYSPYKARVEARQKAGIRNPAPNRRSNRGQHRRPATIFSATEANDRLYDIFRNHEATFISHEQRDLMARFYELLMKEQEHNNFTRIMTIKDVGLKHFLDSVLVMKLTKLQFPLMDMGTGPGFPGIPLKFMFPQEKIILAEGVQKRVNFLKKVRESLNLKNLDIIGRNIDEEFEYPLMGVITRAVEDASNTLRNVSNCVEVGGRVYLMKGPNVDPELKMAEEWKEFYKLLEDHDYEIPGTPYKRRLLVFEKIKNLPYTPEDFSATPDDMKNLKRYLKDKGFDD